MRDKTLLETSATRAKKTMNIVFCFLALIVATLSQAKIPGAKPTSDASSFRLEYAGIFICPATPLAKNIAVTAGHCLSELSLPSDYKVSGPGESYEILSIERLGNDIALLRVKREFPEFFETASANFDEPFDVFFPSSRVPGKRSGVLTPDSKGFAAHGLPSKKGDSGTPVFQKGRLVGLHVGKMLHPPRGLIALVEPNISMAPGGATFTAAHEKEAPPLIAAAIAWCGSNPPACAAMIGASATVTSAAILGTLNYLASLNNSEKAIIQKQLDTCTAEKASIIEQLIQESAAQNSRGRPSGSFESQAPSEGSEGIPDGVLVIDLRVPPSGATRCAWDGPSLRCVYSPEALGTAAREFLFLARLAFLHKFHSEKGRWPTEVEIGRIKGELLSESLPALVSRAVGDTGINVQPPLCFGRGCVEP